MSSCVTFRVLHSGRLTCDLKITCLFRKNHLNIEPNHHLQIQNVKISGEPIAIGHGYHLRNLRFCKVFTSPAEPTKSSIFTTNIASMVILFQYIQVGSCAYIIKIRKNNQKTIQSKNAISPKHINIFSNQVQ